MFEVVASTLAEDGWWKMTLDCGHEAWRQARGRYKEQPPKFVRTCDHCDELQELNAWYWSEQF